MARAIKYIFYASRVSRDDTCATSFAKWQGGEDIASPRSLNIEMFHFEKRREKLANQR